MDKNLGGRPPFYKSPEELAAKVDEYFEVTPFMKQTITGIALYLGFESRQSFYAYEQKEGFSYTIKRARARIEEGYEQVLKDGGGAGPIFVLKNMGWTDKQEVVQTTSTRIVVTKDGDEMDLTDLGI